jgi:hypothetical protein
MEGPLTVLVVTAAALFVSAGALQACRTEEHAAARDQHRPLSVVMRPGDKLLGLPVAPGCGAPQPGVPLGNPGSERSDPPATGPSALPAGRPSGSCVLIWLP